MWEGIIQTNSPSRLLPRCTVPMPESHGHPTLVSEQLHCSGSSLIYSLPYSCTKATKGSIKAETDVPKSLHMGTYVWWILLNHNFNSCLIKWTLHLFIYWFTFSKCMCMWCVCMHIQMCVGVCMCVSAYACVWHGCRDPEIEVRCCTWLLSAADWTETCWFGS